MNKWYCCKCGHEFSNDGTYPGACPKCGNTNEGNGFMAMTPASRVTGHTYTPYQQSTAWAKAANASMAETARSNFQRSRTH